MLHLDLLVVAKFIMKVDPDKLHAADQRDMMSDLATLCRVTMLLEGLTSWPTSCVGPKHIWKSEVLMLIGAVQSTHETTESTDSQQDKIGIVRF